MSTPAPIVRLLTTLDRPALQAHFLALDAEDRRLRFGISLPDDAVLGYVERIDFVRDAVFGIGDDALQLVGVAHLARGEGDAELGLSVLPGQRGRGLGAALLARAHTHARNAGERRLFMHCLRENGAVMHLARKQGMRIVGDGGEADALLDLPPGSPATHAGEAIDQVVALFDHALKTRLAHAREVAEVLTGVAAGASAADDRTA